MSDDHDGNPAWLLLVLGLGALVWVAVVVGIRWVWERLTH